MKCECGCGEETTVYRGVPRRFILGHNGRGKKNTLGYKHTDSAKKKISEARTGRKHTDKTKRKLRGFKHTDKVKQKLSEAQSGERGSNWQGGISFEPYCPKFNYKFKESVREKFSRVCFLCGIPENGRKLDVHHVNYDKSCLCSEVECEFVPLCVSCHSKISKSNKEYWENLIMDKLRDAL